MLWLAVALGGAMGAVARYGVSVGVVAVAGTNAAAPVATLLVNVVGSGAMGAVYGFLSGGGAMPESLRAIFGGRIFGGFDDIFNVFVGHHRAHRHAPDYVGGALCGGVGGVYRWRYFCCARH